MGKLYCDKCNFTTRKTAIMIDHKKKVHKCAKKTIIILSAKRSGSTAIYNVFNKHSVPKTCTKNKRFLELNFWNYAAEALAGNYKNFVRRMSEFDYEGQLPDEGEYTEKIIFDIWDKLLERHGPVLFDKSPRYLGSSDALDLILKYQKTGKGRDVRFVCLMRNPLDCIASQKKRWGMSLKFRDKSWVNYYKNFEKLQHKLGEQNKTAHLVKMEDFMADPNKFIGGMLKFCGLDDEKKSYSHIKWIDGVSVLNYLDGPEFLEWTVSPQMTRFFEKYGYNKQYISVGKDRKALLAPSKESNARYILLSSEPLTEKIAANTGAGIKFQLKKCIKFDKVYPNGEKGDMALYELIVKRVPNEQNPIPNNKNKRGWEEPIKIIFSE